ncbi:MAG: GNAT family N-acetyltransferase [Daejeonella sp.]|uniref:GNAT family N-acetyltransferase n=1 Tax=Daejeonella sp. TaxID=2805397 RepID=UPI002735276B|nr:GNAT family N-acetyltransferase [Daejeonella sp.]MDP3469125.1 GNAT family N-acetyltransferase [Daejeonella sp.]
MIIKDIQNQDIDQLNLLQPADWDDIRPYFYYYSSSSFCDPIKIVDANAIVAVGTIIKHQDTAWLAHLIVHKEYRNQGLGKILTNALVERSDPKIFKTIYLDATDMGYPVYKKVGFEIEMDYMHLDGNLLNLNLKNPASVIPFDEKYRAQVLELDKITSGENREVIFRDHLKSSLLYLSEGIVRGAYFPGFFDRYIMAELPEAGTELMKLRMRVKNTTKLPIINQAGIDFLLDNSYNEVRRSKRMILGEKREWKAENNFNRISGGLG